MRRTFLFQDEKSNKFWEIEQNGASVTTWWGRIGTSGQTKTKDFASNAKAEAEYKKLVEEKTGKGYVESTGSAGPVSSSQFSPLPDGLDQFIAKLLKTSNHDEAVEILVDDGGNHGAEQFIFWVDWREEDDSIIEACESVLQTEELSGELEDADHDDGYDIYIEYKGKRKKVPLSYSPEDRHITICALNKVLQPKYEVRFCIDSHGADTLAFLPLSSAGWKHLEKQHGELIDRHFYKIQEKPNLYTDPLEFDKSGRLVSKVS